MALSPYKINDRRSAYVGASNLLYDAGAQKSVRRQMPRTDRDTRKNLSQLGWREIMSAARWICANFGPVDGAIRQMANYAVGRAYNVQYIGRNKAWGAKMEEALYQHDKICDVRGDNFDFRTSLKLDLRTLIRDGDCASLLVEGDGGYPFYQSIPSHRIGSRSYVALTVDGGPYAGMMVTNGVIQNDYGRAIAYQVFRDDYISTEREDISSKDMVFTYSPVYQDQSRGISWLAQAINDVADIFDIRSFLKLGIKSESALALLEFNEKGAPMDTGSSIISGGPTDDAPTTPFYEKLEGGAIRYFRANSGSKIEVPSVNRPGENAQKFAFEILRGSFEALGWPIEFYNPEMLGGANIRLRVAQAKRTIEDLQLLADKIAIRKHTYAIAKLIKIGALDPDPDWWRIEHQCPRDITVDNGRDVKADIDMYLKGAITLKELCERGGDYWEDIQDQKIAEEKRWQEKCKAANVDPNNCRLLGQLSIQNDPQAGAQNQDTQQ
jgi:hypothetical protein